MLSPNRCRTVLSYCTCVSLRIGSSRRSGGVSWVDSSSKSSEARYSTQRRSKSSSSLSAAMRGPPVCGILLVGLSKSADWLISAWFTRRLRPSPNRWTTPCGAPSSGNWSLVPDATPEVLWQARQFFASRRGYRSAAKSSGASAHGAGIASSDANASTPAMRGTGPTRRAARSIGVVGCPASDDGPAAKRGKSRSNIGQC